MATATQVEAVRTTAVPWYIWVSVAAVTSAMIGIHWDISWHRSIGRDTFLTPAHVAIYLCGVLAAIACGYLILATTFANRVLRSTSVSVWGFRGPLGAFIAAWGGLVMLTSAPFDDWWHGAYGLDVQILSPPHVVLAIGMVAVEFGALVLIAAPMNRETGAARLALQRIFLYVGGMILIVLLILALEYSTRIWMHTATFYCVVSLMVPVALAMASRASGARWGATSVALVYSVFLLLCLYILPLFPAQAKLGPVYHVVTRFIPAGFPLLIVVPAIALDRLWAKTGSRNAWLVALLSSGVFLVIFAAVQWPFGTFLMTPAAHGYLFGSGYLDYNVGPQSFAARNLFIPPEPQFWQLIALAYALGVLSVRAGWASGDWIRHVRR